MKRFRFLCILTFLSNIFHRCPGSSHNMAFSTLKYREESSDLKTQTITNTGAAGIFPAIYRNKIVFTTPEEDINQDLNGDGKILGNVIHTLELGTEHEIYENTITFYLWEAWSGQDLNGDGDRSDPIMSFRGDWISTCVMPWRIRDNCGIFLYFLGFFDRL